jgi:hypothetical protein
VGQFYALLPSLSLLKIKFTVRKLFFLAAIASITFLGGLLLILFGADIMPVNNYDFVDRLVGYRFDFFTVVAGAAMVTTSVMLIPWVIKLKKEHDTLGLDINHYLRNALQVITLNLEIAAQENISLEASRYLDEANAECANAIEILNDITRGSTRINNSPRVQFPPRILRRFSQKDIQVAVGLQKIRLLLNSPKTVKEARAIIKPIEAPPNGNRGVGIASLLGKAKHIPPQCSEEDRVIGQVAEVPDPESAIHSEAI